MDLDEMLKIWGAIVRVNPGIYDRLERTRKFQALLTAMGENGQSHQATLIWPTVTLCAAAAETVSENRMEMDGKALPHVAYHTVPVCPALACWAYLVERDTQMLLVIGGPSWQIKELPEIPNWLHAVSEADYEDVLRDLQKQCELLVCFGVVNIGHHVTGTELCWSGVLKLALDIQTKQILMNSPLAGIWLNKPFRFIHSLPASVAEPEDALTFNYYIRLFLDSDRIMIKDLVKFAKSDWLAEDIQGRLSE